MSKSPSAANLFLPAVGGAALVLGVAYGLASMNYGSDRIEALQSSFDQERATSAEALERLAGLQSALAAAEEQVAAARAEAELRMEHSDAQLAALQAQLDAALTNAGAFRAVSAPAASTGIFGLGRPAHPEEIDAWDVDVLPDGRGLPEGSGDVWTGEEVFAENCAACHGDFAEGRDAWPVLAGGFDTLDDRDPVKTVGSYWPYLSTVWDYVHRSMPFGAAGTLSDDDVYAITAYILYSNDLVDDDFTLSNETFADVEMYNTDGFIVDDRAVTEYPIWSGEPCMTDCRAAPAEITRRATDVGVTPADDGSMAESVMEEQLAVLGGTEWGKERVAGSVFMGPGGVAREEEPDGGQDVASTEDTETATDAEDPAESGPDPALLARGESVFKKCSSCHQVGEGAKNRSGPQLNGVVGRQIGAVGDFRYSSAFKEAQDAGKVWDESALAEFLADPRGFMDGTKMSFRGLPDQADIEAVIAYLRTHGE